jgi:nucleotide-binding universal stress UspA family protein
MTPISILIPHDASPAASAVIESLGPLLTPGTRVTLLHVDEGAQRGTDEIDDAERQLSERGAEVSRAVVVSTDPASTIVDLANETRPDLVAMSTHGQSGRHSSVRGGVAERVLRACPVPLFMGNPFVAVSARLSSVLVPLETTTQSAEILDSLIPIATAAGSRLTFLFVDFDDPTDSDAQRVQRRASRLPDIETWLAEPRKRAESAGVEVAIRVAHGNPSTEIVRSAEPGEFDLLAMTTHARAGVSRWAFGSVAERVLRECRIPIFVHRMGLRG